MMNESMSTFCARIPKIELHAHIHGCIRQKTLQMLIQDHVFDERNKPSPLLLSHFKRAESPLNVPQFLDLNNIFNMFALVHEVVISGAVLQRLVIEAIEDFAADNVKYLELRSTPRPLPHDGLTRDQYVEKVEEAIHACSIRSDLDIEVRLLLSINRANSYAEAEEIVEIALARQSLLSNVIVGLDFSGNPTAPNSNFGMFEPIFSRARKKGLKITLHFAEIFGSADTKDILSFGPERVGHACCLSPEEYQQLKQSNIAVEICFTSNVWTRPELRNHCTCCARDSEKLTMNELCIKSSSCEFCRYNSKKLVSAWKNTLLCDCLCGYTIHPLRQFLFQDDERTGCYTPVCLCTDDPGVFQNPITVEYLRIAYAFQLSKEKLFEIASGSISLIFDSTAKERLIKIFAEFKCQFSCSGEIGNTIC